MSGLQGNKEIDKNLNRTELLKVNVFCVYIVSKQLHHVAFSLNKA